MFIEPRISDVKLSKKIGATCIELHTGKFCNMYNKKKNTVAVYKNLLKVANFAKEIGLEVHAGHGLTFGSTYKISRIKSITEFNIGHFLISEALFIGLKDSIKKFKKIINK